MSAFISYLEDFHAVSILLRLLLAMLVGGVIGIERGKQGRAAGMRTHILVCIGATLTSLIGYYLYERGMATDPTRISAQVISGIGFLGVGTILLKGRFQITGLTTAAGLWATAAIGIALGAGFYLGALVTFAVIVLTVTILHRIEYRLTKRYSRFGMYMEIRDTASVRTAIDRLHASYTVTDIQVTPPRSGKSESVGIEANIHVSSKDVRVTPEDVAHALETEDYVLFAIESI